MRLSTKQTAAVLLTVFACAAVAALAFKASPAAAMRDLRQRWAERDPYLHYARASKQADDRLARLESLGYLGAVQSAGRSGVTVYDPEETYAAPRLLTLGHRPEAQLITPSGEILHRWSREFSESFPEEANLSGRLGARLWRRVRLLEDGGLLAIHEYLGTVRIDAESNLVWARLNGAHHDIEPSERGTFYVLVAEESGGRLHDFVAEIDGDGEELRRISIEGAFERSPYGSQAASQDEYDPLHTNEITALKGRFSGRIPAFRRGDLLLSMRNISALAVLDPRAGRIVWVDAGSFRRQHAPRIVDGGRVLLFDNFGDGGRSRAMEYDPATGATTWAYDNSHGPLFSEVCGAVQRLPNGNTLITETDAGRVIEVTPERRIVWEYVTPHRKGDLVARVLEAVALEDVSPLP